MNLLFPQWQGAGNRPELRRGALELASSRPALKWQQMDVTESFGEAVGINAYAEIAGQLGGALAFLTQNRPETLFTLGGDCSVELAPVSYLKSRYPNLGVVWFDAHADLQAPETSPSGNLHGMPLRLLLGEGDGTSKVRALKQTLPSSIRPEQVVLVGVRALDPEEEEVTTRLRLTTLSAAEVKAQPGLVAETVRLLGWREVYLHVDLDVLDPGAFSSLGWPEPGGLTVASLVAALGVLHRALNVVGGGLTEYLPTAGSEHTDAAAALEILDAWLG